MAFAALTTSVFAQPAPQAPSLRQALDAAWQISGPLRSESSRRSELAAKEKASNSWLSGETVAGIAYRTDRFNKNEGFRDYEAEVELPLWNPGVRTAAQADVAAQRRGFDGQLRLSKLKLAGELRALSASVATAQVELDLNKRKLAQANAMTQDVMHRVKVGENARVDALQAQVLTLQAQAAMAHADSQLSRLQSQWRSLTGLSAVAPPDEIETPASAPASQAPVTSVPPEHPALRYAQAQLVSAQTRLALANADQRDPMSIAVGASRERSIFAAAYENKLRIALRIPLGGDNRNAPRQAAAQAELDTAQAEFDALQRQLPAEVAAANAELGAARAAQTAARERTRLSTEVQILIAKSWQLGDSDLPTRLRADNEQFEASLALAKASIDVQRAIANLNQAHGILP